MIFNNDWKEFLIDRWNVKPTDFVYVRDIIPGSEIYNLPSTFKNKYPLLSELLMMARVSDLQFNNDLYRLLGWTDHRGTPFGWLTRPPVLDINKPLGEDHILLLTQFGGIVESWNEDYDGESWLFNLWSAMTYEDSQAGGNGYEVHIDNVFQDTELKPYIDLQDYIYFAVEGNGSLTLYNKIDSSIIMITHDHCFKHITAMEGYPEMTIYTINDCPDFASWVETVARQTLNRINGS